MDVEALKELIEMRFDNVDRRLDGLTDQVAQTNGRVRNHEAQIPAINERLLAAERDIKHAREPKADDDGENRRLTKWDALLVLGSIAATVTVIKLIGLIK